jgi:TetR/AcrR family transcriptional regulator
MPRPAALPVPTRDQILDAAEAVFAARGFEASTIKDLAGAADVNSALLYYYFGDKERLYHAVLERVVHRISGQAAARLAAPGAPDERLRRFLLLQAELLSTDRHFWPLVLRELVDHGAEHAVEQIRIVAATVFRALCELIEEGQRNGVFRRELDPRFAAISSMSVVAHFFTARPAIGIFLGGTTDGPPPATVRAYAQHAAEYAVAALRAPTGGSR